MKEKKGKEKKRDKEEHAHEWNEWNEEERRAVMSYELKSGRTIMNYELWIMNYELKSGEEQLWVMSYELKSGTERKQRKDKRNGKQSKHKNYI